MRLRLSTSLALILLLSGCNSLDKDPNAPVAVTSSNVTGVNAAGFSAYKSSFYVFALANCSGCHGISQNPLFAVSDPTSAYITTLTAGIVDFNNPSASTIVKQADNGHCNLPFCSGKGSAAEAALTPWATAELASPSSGGPVVPVDNSGPRAKAAMTVLQNACITCHNSTQNGSLGTVPAYGTAVTAFMSGGELLTLNQYFVQNGLVIQGNASSSWLYNALKGYGNIGTMPNGGAAVSAANAQAIADWIDQMGSP